MARASQPVARPNLANGAGFAGTPPGTAADTATSIVQQDGGQPIHEGRRFRFLSGCAPGEEIRAADFKHPPIPGGFARVRHRLQRPRFKPVRRLQEYGCHDHAQKLVRKCYEGTAIKLHPGDDSSAARRWFHEIWGICPSRRATNLTRDRGKILSRQIFT
jgi:hypothetical protein